MFPNNVVATPETYNLGGVLYFSLFCVGNMFANCNPLRLQSLPSASSTMTARWRHYHIYSYYRDVEFALVRSSIYYY